MTRQTAAKGPRVAISQAAQADKYKPIADALRFVFGEPRKEPLEIPKAALEAMERIGYKG